MANDNVEIEKERQKTKRNFNFLFFFTIIVFITLYITIKETGPNSSTDVDINVPSGKIKVSVDKPPENEQKGTDITGDVKEKPSSRASEVNIKESDGVKDIISKINTAMHSVSYKAKSVSRFENSAFVANPIVYSEHDSKNRIVHIIYNDSVNGKKFQMEQYLDLYSEMIYFRNSSNSIWKSSIPVKSLNSDYFDLNDKACNELSKINDKGNTILKGNTYFHEDINDALKKFGITSYEIAKAYIEIQINKNAYITYLNSSVSGTAKSINGDINFSYKTDITYSDYGVDLHLAIPH